MKKVSGILAAVFLCLLLCRSEVYAATQDIDVYKRQGEGKWKDFFRQQQRLFLP